MGQGSSDQTAEAVRRIELENTQRRSSNGAVAAARLHSQGSRRSLQGDYEVEAGTNSVLSKGQGSVVTMVTSRVDSRKCVLKAFRFARMSPEAIGLMKTEVELLLSLDHPNIVRLHDVYERTDAVYMVMEYCAGGELFNHLQSHKRLDEVETARISRQMLAAVSYLHSHDIAHRDLKLENFLFFKDDLKRVKLVDFGFSTICVPGETMRASCGTRDYVSPEVLRKNGYTNKCDMWSVGVIIFMMLTGRTPVQGETVSEIHDRIRRADVQWELLSEKAGSQEPAAGRAVSKDAFDFLQYLLVRNPEKRLTAQQAMFHPWIIRIAGAPAESGMDFSLVRSLHCYSQFSHLKRAVLQLIARDFTPIEEADELISTFLTLSHGGDGIIDRMFAGLEINQNWQFYYSDFVAVAAFLSSAVGQARQELPSEAVHAAFSRLDADCSGAITASDLDATFGGGFNGVTGEGMIAEVAADGQSELSFEAFAAIIQASTKTCDMSSDSDGNMSRQVSVESQRSCLGTGRGRMAGKAVD